MKIEDSNKFFNESILEMGRRVGLDWKTFDDVLLYQDKNGEQWYATKTWTKEDENSFRDWLRLKFKKNYSTKFYTDKKIDYEINMFILCYGWKVEYEPV